MLSDELRLFLPKYLSAENYDILIKELESFPNNIDRRMYTCIQDEHLICQGDVLSSLPYCEIDHLGNGVKTISCIVLSNTCDTDINNTRLFSSRIQYSPLVSLEKYRSVLKKHAGVSEQQIDDHIKSIKSQHISQILYLPESHQFKESIVFFDKTINIDSRSIDRNTLKCRRLVSLSDYGFYMLLFKLSVHFCRVQEHVERGSSYDL